MRIAMFTNAYEPVIGGIERSIANFAHDLRELGHEVLIVTLVFPGAEKSTPQIIRLPALKEVGNSPFSVRLPVPSKLKDRLDDFQPDLVHAHHPFMLGDTALRVGRKRGIPVIFTHHTLYERYVYMFRRDSAILAAMDIFAFASHTETQGLVLAESFAAGVPVVALDAPGVRDIVVDNRNGRLLKSTASIEEYATALNESIREENRNRWRKNCESDAWSFDRRKCAQQLALIYSNLECEKRDTDEEDQFWLNLQDRFAAEWNLFKEKWPVIFSAIAEYQRVSRNLRPL